jgi:hypothetical protein
VYDEAMSRAFVALLLLALAIAPGCTCKSASVTGDPDAGTQGAGATTEASAGATASGETAHLSAPIAAARVGGGAVVVAGLVVPDKAIVVTRLEAGGGTGFTVTALHGVAWSQDAELRVYPADGGVVVVWRGPREGKAVRQLVAIGKGGELKGGPLDIGAVACATEDGLVWTERGTGGKSRVVLKGWSDPAREVAVIAAEREPVVVCGAHRVYALGQGEDDITFATAEAAAAGHKMVLAASDFGADEEREIAEYSAGDDLGIVRVGSGGQVALREAKADGLGPWKRLTSTIPADDNLVAVDADAKTTFVLTTRETAGACGDGSSSLPSSVQALRVDRTTLAEGSVEVAPAECGKELGPFWTGTVGGRFVVAWAERAGKRDALSAPIAGLAYRVVGGAEPSAVVHVARAADSLVDAGCDKDHCYAVALVRTPNTTNLVPEVVQAITYP